MGNFISLYEHSLDEGIIFPEIEDFIHFNKDEKQKLKNQFVKSDYRSLKDK